MCMTCGFTSTTYDPCVDISLDLEPNQGGSAKMASTKSNHSCNGEADGMNSSQNRGIYIYPNGMLGPFYKTWEIGHRPEIFLPTVSGEAGVSQTNVIQYYSHGKPHLIISSYVPVCCVQLEHLINLGWVSEYSLPSISYILGNYKKKKS